MANKKISDLTAGSALTGTELIEIEQSSTSKYTTPAGLKTYLDTYYLARFTSTAQTITSAGSLTIAHGLGSTPFFISAYIKCTSAEVGYSVGDIVYVHTSASTVSYTGFSNNGVCISTNGTTNIDLRFGSAAAVFIVPNKTTGNSTALTNASWQLYLIAQK